jgi:hypothetical protein
MMMRTRSLYLFIGLFILVHPLTADEKDSVKSIEGHSLSSSSGLVDSTSTKEDESLGEEAHSIGGEPSDHFLCRVCGNMLFSRDQHLHGPLLTGPRIVSVRNEPDLGERGTLHDISRTNVNGFVSAALFDSNLPNGVAVGALSDSSSFSGYSQRQVLCGRCGQPIGWRFDSANSVYASGPASGGNRVSIETPSGSSTPSAQGGIPPVSSNHPTSTSSSSPSTSSGNVDPYANIPKVVAPFSEDEEDIRLSSLLNAPCLPFSRGFWSFEYCHKHRVNQFHSEANGVKDPIWSLGDYDTSGKVERTRPLSSASGYYTSHFYTGGQICHETNKGRSSEVQFFCCPHSSVPILEEVEEPSICRYRIRVCVPSACIPEPNAVAALNSAAKVTHIVSNANGEKGEGNTASMASTAIDASSAPNSPPNREDDFFDDGNGAVSSSSSSSLPTTTATTESGTSTPESDEKSKLQQHQSPSSSLNSDKTLLYGPGSIFDPTHLPPTFIAAAWHTVLGDKSEAMQELEEGELNTGIAQVRF